MKQLTDKIYYIPKQKEPLSAEVFVIYNDNQLFVYDVGNGENYIEALNQIENKSVVLSHFHPDHIKNIENINYISLYQSKNTAKYTKIENYQSELEGFVYDLPSSHAKGCLALEVDGYLFVGDALYPSNKGLYNVNAVLAQIKLLKKESIQYVICSHHEPLIRDKVDVLKSLETIYSHRNKNEAYIKAS